MRIMHPPPGVFAIFLFVLSSRADQQDAADNYAYKSIATSATAKTCALYLNDSATTPCWEVPSYDAAVWPNPTLDDYAATWDNLDPPPPYAQASAEDPNGLCDAGEAYDLDRCCRPAAGCLPARGFNWVLSTCAGTTCGDWGQADAYAQWAAGAFPSCSDDAAAVGGRCVDDADDASEGDVVCTKEADGSLDACANQTVVKATIDQRNAGSDVEVNYVAAFSFKKNSSSSSSSGYWEKDPESSFNTYGKHPPQSLSEGGASSSSLPASERWMPGPMPGGAVFWNSGYYPGGVSGVGASSSRSSRSKDGEEEKEDDDDDDAKAMMFVLSTNRLHNVAFYVMNQATLDRGPAFAYPSSSSSSSPNTWACANSGEWDVLEPSWSQPGAGEDGSYDTLYATTSNQGDAGRALWPSYGATGSGIGGFGSDCYVTGSVDVPQLTVAVVDAAGLYTYSFPCSDASAIWPGMACDAIDDTLLDAAPVLRPDSASPCADPAQFCAVFNPFAQASNATADLAAQAAFAPNDRGFCGNFLVDNYERTQEPWGSTPVTLGGVAMPWTEEMECGTAAAAASEAKRGRGFPADWRTRTDPYSPSSLAASSSSSSSSSLEK